MKPRLRFIDYLLLPVVICLFALFAVVTFAFGHQPEEDEDA